MAELTRDQRVSDLTVSDFKELVREVLREERHKEYYIDEEGYLVFANEEAYAAYLDKQKGKLPSEVKAYFIDEQGFKALYSDWEPTPEKAKELEEIRQEPTVPAEQVWDELRDLGVDIRR